MKIWAEAGSQTETDAVKMIFRTQVKREAMKRYRLAEGRRVPWWVQTDRVELRRARRR